MTDYNPRSHTIKLPGRKDRDGRAGPPIDYLPVAERVRWFREEHPDGIIDSTVVEITADRAVFRVRVSIPGDGGGEAEAHGNESRTGFPDYIGKAETVALGRALATLGYGIAFADEFDERRELADPKEYEIGQAAVMQPKAEAKHFPTPKTKGGFQQPVEKPLSDAMPDATPREIALWFQHRLATITVNPAPTAEQLGEKAKSLAMTLTAAGLGSKDRQDAYSWLTGEVSGKDMTAEQLALLFRNADKVDLFHLCALAERNERIQGDDPDAPAPLLGVVQ